MNTPKRDREKCSQKCSPIAKGLQPPAGCRTRTQTAVRSAGSKISGNIQMVARSRSLEKREYSLLPHAIIGCNLVESRFMPSIHGPKSRFLSLTRPGRRAGCRCVSRFLSLNCRHPAYAPSVAQFTRWPTWVHPSASHSRWQRTCSITVIASTHPHPESPPSSLPASSHTFPC